MLKMNVNQSVAYFVFMDISSKNSIEQLDKWLEYMKESIEIIICGDAINFALLLFYLCPISIYLA